MNAGRLKELLKNVPDDLPIILSKDPEGNGFYDLDEIALGCIRRYGWEIETIHPDDRDPDDDRHENVVIFWP